MRLVDNCSRPGPNENEFSVKAGGTRRVGDFTYRIEPVQQRYDYTQPLWWKCVCHNKGWRDECRVEGRGWATGDNGNRIRDNSQGCSPVTTTR